MTFEKELAVVTELFQSWSEEQCEMALRNMLKGKGMDKSRFKSIAQTIGFSSQDNITSILSVELTLRIFRHLDPFSLLIVSCVNTRWRKTAQTTALWKCIWTAQRWIATDLEKALIQDQQWRAVCKHRLRIDRNWVRGEYFVDSAFGHQDSVTCIQFDKDIIVSGSHDSNIIVWDLKTREKIATLSNGAPLTSLKLYKKKLISSSWDGTINVWDRNIFNHFSLSSSLWDRTTHTAILCTAYNNGRYCLTGSLDNNIRIFDIRSGICRFVLRGHLNSVLALQFDKEIIVSGSEDQSIRVWNTRTYTCKYTLLEHTGAVTCIQFNDEYIVSGSCDRTAIIWNRHSGRVIHKLTGHRGAIHCLQFSQGKLVTGAGNDTLKVWDMESGKCLYTLDVHESSVNCLMFNYRYLLSGAADGSVQILDFGFDEYEDVSGNGSKIERALALPGPFSLEVVFSKSRLNQASPL